MQKGARRGRAREGSGLVLYTEQAAEQRRRGRAVTAEVRQEGWHAGVKDGEKAAAGAAQRGFEERAERLSFGGWVMGDGWVRSAETRAHNGACSLRSGWRYGWKRNGVDVRATRVTAGAGLVRAGALRPCP